MAPAAAAPPMTPDEDDFSPAASHPPVAEAPSTDNPCTRPESEEALLACEHREFDRAQEAIGRREAALRERFGKEPALLEALANAQAKWREFRDAECGLDTYDSRDGTAFESYWLACLRKLDWQRASRLQFLLDNP